MAVGVDVEGEEGCCAGEVGLMPGWRRALRPRDRGLGVAPTLLA